MDYTSSVIATATKYGVDPNLALSVMQAESGGNAGAISPKGAIGLFQLMPKTAAGLNVNPNDPLQNIDGGVRLLSQLSTRYNGDIDLTLAAYNAGPTAVSNAGGVPPFQETINYIARVKSFLGFGDSGSSGSDTTNDTTGFDDTTGNVDASVFGDIQSNEGLIALGLGLLVALIVVNRS